MNEIAELAKQPGSDEVNADDPEEILQEIAESLSNDEFKEF